MFDTSGQFRDWKAIPTEVLQWLLRDNSICKNINNQYI